MTAGYHDRDRSPAVSPLAHVIEALGIEMPQKLDTAIETSHVVSVTPLSGVLEQIASPRDAWACKIKARWNMAVADIIATGKLLIDAKAELAHGEFQEMVRRDLGWTPRTAQRLMAIADHPVLSDATHVSLLPPSWGTLAELARVKPERLRAAIDAGTVSSTMPRSAVSAILWDESRRAAIERRESHRADLERERASRPPTPESPPSPAEVLRGIAEETGEVYAAIDVLFERLLKATDVFGEPRKKVKEYGPAEYLDDLLLSVQEARDALGVHYDDLAQLAGLPTREQS